MNGSGVLEGPPEAHDQQFVAHLAVEKLRELAEADQPWSLVASFWGPHQPYYPSEPFAGSIDPRNIPEHPSFRDDFAGRPLRHHIHYEMAHAGKNRLRGDWPAWQEICARAYEQAMQLDAAVGEVLDALAETQQADNTLVIYVADHGDALASHGGLFDKCTGYLEEVARVPMAIRWPAAVGEGRTLTRPVSNLDVTATMLEAAGVDVPDSMQSRSLLGLCRGEGADRPDHTVAEHHGHGGTRVRQRAIVTERYKYVAAEFDGDELYDLVEDPYELRNLVDAPEVAGVRDDLRERLIEHIEAAGDRTARFILLGLKRGFH
jgi:arylsulfatase A-like enzyme